MELELPTILLILGLIVLLRDRHTLTVFWVLAQLLRQSQIQKWGHLVYLLPRDPPNTPADPAPASPNYISTKNYGWQFSAGEATGTWSEVGVGWFEDDILDATNHRIWSRVKIVDGGGTPVTITLLADEVLDVFYILKASMPLSDDTKSVTISGTSYSYTLRRADAGSGILGLAFGADIVGTNLYDGNIGSITEFPSGVSDYAPNYEAAHAYVNNSYTLGYTVVIPLGTANFSGGIKSITPLWSSGRLMNPLVQYEFSTPIPKTSTKTLSLDISFSWARA